MLDPRIHGKKALNGQIRDFIPIKNIIDEIEKKISAETTPVQEKQEQEEEDLKTERKPRSSEVKIDDDEEYYEESESESESEGDENLLIKLISIVIGVIAMIIAIYFTSSYITIVDEKNEIYKKIVIGMIMLGTIGGGFYISKKI